MRLFIFILIIPTSFLGQMLDNRGCAVFSGEPFFYTEFIRSNKIKSITGCGFHESRFTSYKK